ncbi:MAG TPA: flagellar protein FlaG [Bacillota bacterium]
MAQSLRAVGGGVSEAARYPALEAADAPKGRQAGTERDPRPRVESPGRGSDAGGEPQASASRVSLAFHAASGRWMAVYIDQRTGEVVRTRPPKELLDAVGRVRLALGLYLDAYR